MDGKITSIIIGMAIVTYLTRMLPLLGLSQLNLPAFLRRFLDYIPVSVFSALLFPDLLLANGRIDIGLDNLNIWAGLICLAVILKTRSLALTVCAGILTFLLLGFL